jgi:hypothetical protein
MAPSIKLTDKAHQRVREFIEAGFAVGEDRQLASDLQALLQLHDEVHEVKGKETAQGRVNRLTQALNCALTLTPDLRIASIGTRVEVRPAKGHYYDPGLDHVAEFAEAFGAYVSPETVVPDYGPVAAVHLRGYCSVAKALGEDLKAYAAECLEYNDEGGALALIRLQLCQEELAELAQGIINRDIVECLDALTDMSYVCDGTYLTLGLGHYKLAAYAEVHASNMSKLGPDGKPIFCDAGRVVKGPNYVKPDLSGVLGMNEEER